MKNNTLDFEGLTRMKCRQTELSEGEEGGTGRGLSSGLWEDFLGVVNICFCQRCGWDGRIKTPLSYCAWVWAARGGITTSCLSGSLFVRQEVGCYHEKGSIRDSIAEINADSSEDIEL